MPEPSSDLELIHYGLEYVTRVDSCPQNPHSASNIVGKPCGLWVSVKGEDDWENWCRSEGFRLETLVRQTRLHLKPDARVLRIATAIELDNFSQTYGGEAICHLLSIDWQRVAESWQAIIIAPYIWERRLPRDLKTHQLSFWYYSWDCASGCIWDADAVERLEQLQECRDATK